MTTTIKTVWQKLKPASREERHRHKRQVTMAHSMNRHCRIMTIQEEDISKSDGRPERLCDDDDDDERLVLRDDRDSTATRSAPNECAICLAAYEVNDTVVWSHNTTTAANHKPQQDGGCTHAFHADCLQDWWLSQSIQQCKGVCPCCRQEFTPLPKPPEIKWQAGCTYNPAVVRFR